MSADKYTLQQKVFKKQSIDEVIDEVIGEHPRSQLGKF